MAESLSKYTAIVQPSSAAAERVVSILTSKSRLLRIIFNVTIALYMHDMSEY